MARRPRTAPNDFIKTLKEVAGQQAGHFVGKNLSRLAAINALSSMMNTRFLSALKLLGPAVASASGQSAFKVFQEKTGLFKELDGTNAGEAMEAVFTGFFMNLGKYGPNPTDEQAQTAYQEASASAFAKYANPNLPAVNVSNGVINDRALQALIDMAGIAQAMQVIDLYNIGIANLTFAALDPSVPARIAVEAAMAFNHGDFSDVAKLLAFARAVMANQSSLRQMVLACAGVVQASTKADHQALRAKFQAERLGGRVLSWLGVNMNEENALNILANWIAPGIMKDAQLSGLLLALWIVIYVVTFIPSMFFASRGMIFPMWAFITFNLLNNLLMLDLLSKVVGMHAAVFGAVGKLIGKEEETPPYPDILPAKWHLVLRFRPQATSPALIMGSLVSLLHFSLGFQPFMFLVVFSFMMIGITTSILIVLRERSMSEWGKFWLGGGVRFLIPALVGSVLIDLVWNYKAGLLAPKGMWVIGGLHSRLVKAESLGDMSFFSFVAVLLTVCLLAGAVMALKEKNFGAVAALALAALCIGGVGQCSMGSPERQASAQAREVQEHAQRMERLRMERDVAAAGKSVINIGDPVTAMEYSGGPTTRAQRERRRSSGRQPVSVPRRGQETSRNASGQRVRSRASGRNRVEPEVSGTLSYSRQFKLVCSTAPYTRGDYSQASRKMRFTTGQPRRPARRHLDSRRGLPRQLGDEYVAVVINGELVPAVRRDGSFLGNSCQGEGWIRTVNDRSGELAAIDSLTILRLDSFGTYLGGRNVNGDSRQLPKEFVCNAVHCGPGSSSRANRYAGHLPSAPATLARR